MKSLEEKTVKDFKMLWKRLGHCLLVKCHLFDVEGVSRLENRSKFFLNSNFSSAHFWIWNPKGSLLFEIKHLMILISIDFWKIQLEICLLWIKKKFGFSFDFFNSNFGWAFFFSEKSLIVVQDSKLSRFWKLISDDLSIFLDSLDFFLFALQNFENFLLLFFSVFSMEKKNFC